MDIFFMFFLFGLLQVDYYVVVYDDIESMFMWMVICKIVVLQVRVMEMG